MYDVAQKFGAEAAFDFCCSTTFYGYFSYFQKTHVRNRVKLSGFGI
jgi:hypothetical protein